MVMEKKMETTVLKWGIYYRLKLSLVDASSL